MFPFARTATPHIPLGITRVEESSAHTRRAEWGPFSPDRGAGSGASSLALPRWDDARRSVGEFHGVRIHWLELGRAGGRTPVVLLHGLSDAHFTWRRIAPELARDRLVLVPDLPGHGLSGRPDASYELPWYAEVMARWIEALDLAQVDIVGHSLGGGIAQMLLLERACNTRIRRIVLAAAGGLGQDVAMALRFASLPTVVEHFGQPFMALGTRLALAYWRGVLPPGHITELSVINAQEGSARAFARTVHDVIDWRGQRRSFLARAHEIAHMPPIAVLWGDRDSIIPVEHGRALARSVNGVRFQEIKGCGHYLHHDDPPAFLRAVRGALDASTWLAPARVAEGPWALCDRPVARCDRKSNCQAVCPLASGALQKGGAPGAAKARSRWALRGGTLLAQAVSPRAGGPGRQKENNNDYQAYRVDRRHIGTDRPRRRRGRARAEHQDAQRGRRSRRRGEGRRPLDSPNGWRANRRSRPNGGEGRPQVRRPGRALGAAGQRGPGPGHQGLGGQASSKVKGR